MGSHSSAVTTASIESRTFVTKKPSADHTGRQDDHARVRHEPGHEERREQVQPVAQMLGPAAFARLEPPPSARFERDARHMDGRRHLSHDLSFLECACRARCARRVAAASRHAAGRRIERFGEVVMGGS